MNKFKCAWCGKLHTAEEWNTSTFNFYSEFEGLTIEKFEIIKMPHNKNNGCYVCPTCNRAMDGVDIIITC